MDAGLVVSTALISLLKQGQSLSREWIGSDKLVEAPVSKPLAVCAQLDVKGLCKLALTGQIQSMTGANSP